MNDRNSITKAGLFPAPRSRAASPPRSGRTKAGGEPSAGAPRFFSEEAGAQARPGNSAFRPATSMLTAMASRIIPISRDMMTRSVAESRAPMAAAK